MNKIDSSVAASAVDRLEQASNGLDIREHASTARSTFRSIWRWVSLELPDASSTMFRQKMTALDVAKHLRPDENGDIDQVALQRHLDVLQRRLEQKNRRCDWTVANEIELLLVGQMHLDEMRIEAQRQLVDARALRLPSTEEYERLIETHQDNEPALRSTLVRLISDIQGRFRKRYLLREYVAAYTARVSLLFGISTMLFMALIICLSWFAFDYEKSKARDAVEDARNQLQQSKQVRAPSNSGPQPETVTAIPTKSSPARSQTRIESTPTGETASLNSAPEHEALNINPIRAFSSFYIAVLAGLFGAAFSMMAQTRKRVEISTLEDMRTNARFAMLLFRLGVGIGAAMILYFIFDTKVFGTSMLTPDLKEVGFDTPSTERKLIAIGALSPNRHLSLLMLWCFIAGFSEVLVPSILRRTEGEGIPKEAA